MKKRFLSALAVLLVLGAAVSMTGCAGVHPIEQLRQSIAKDPNCTVILTVEDIPLLGTLTATVEMDGGKRHISPVLGSPEIYTETLEGKTSVYTKIAGDKWLKTTAEENKTGSEFIGIDEKMKTVFQKDNFQKTEGDGLCYRQKSGVNFENVRDLKICFEKDACTISGAIDVRGRLLGFKMVMNDFGKVSLTMPRAEQVKA